jgi:glycosyltransferase involved in cell wall biosynthesis
MRILHLLAGAPTGGAETYALDAIESLAERGIAQSVVARPHPLLVERLGKINVPLTPASFSRLSRLFGASRKIAKIADSFQADLMHAWMGRAASFVPEHRSCPALGWFGGYYHLRRFRHVDWFTGVTPDIAAHIVRAGAPADRVTTVHTFGTLPAADPIPRASLGVPEAAPLLLVLSRMHPKKGIDTLLQALTRLPTAHALLAGDGPRLAVYQKLANQLGVAARAHFLGWRTDRAALLATADICVLPSRYEPFGTVIAESWASGTPLVATNAQGARQFVRSGENGMVVEIDDESALAAAIKQLIQQPELRAKLIAGGTEAYHANFHRDGVTDRIIENYQRAIQAGRK